MEHVQRNHYAERRFDLKKVIKMIHDMVAALKKEQTGDEHKKEYCTMQLDVSDDKKKTVSRVLPEAETAIESAK